MTAREHIHRNGISYETSSLPQFEHDDCRVIYYPKIYYGITESSQQYVSPGGSDRPRSKFLGAPMMERCSTPPPTPPSLSPTTSENWSCDSGWSSDASEVSALSRSSAIPSFAENSPVDNRPLKKHMRTRSMTIYSPDGGLDDPNPFTLPAVTVEDTTMPYDEEDGLAI